MTETTTTRDRVLDRAAATETGTAVEKSGKTIFDLIRDQQSGFARALPSMITPERFVRVAITAVRKKPALARCDSMSLLGALTLSAQLGLEPDGPLGHAYLVPFGREVTFIVGYKGYIDLARRSGEIASIRARSVFEGDRFSWTLGLAEDITHDPVEPDRSDPDKITHVYAVARLRDKDAEPIFVVLTRAQVETFRARSKTPNRGPWVDDWEAMALKTAVRRLATWLPLSVEMARAVSADEQTITRIDVNADDFIDVDVDEANDDETGASATTTDTGEPDPTPERLREAQDMYREATKTDHDAWKKFAAENLIPTDSRNWNAAQTERVIAWITAEPEGEQ